MDIFPADKYEKIVIANEYLGLKKNSI